MKQACKELLGHQVSGLLEPICPSTEYFDITSATCRSLEDLGLLVEPWNGTASELELERLGLKRPSGSQVPGSTPDQEQIVTVAVIGR